MTARMRHWRCEHTTSAIFYNSRIVISTPLRRIKCRFFSPFGNDADHTTNNNGKRIPPINCFVADFFSPNVRFSDAIGFHFFFLILYFLDSLESHLFLFIVFHHFSWTCDAPRAHHEFIGNDNARDMVVAAEEAATSVCMFIRLQYCHCHNGLMKRRVKSKIN